MNVSCATLLRIVIYVHILILQFSILKFLCTLRLRELWDIFEAQFCDLCAAQL